MTVISLKHNRYNLVTQKTTWSKRNKSINHKFSLVKLGNYLLLAITIFAITGSLFLEIKMANYRFDIKDLTSQSVILEQKNAELKNQTAVLQNFDKMKPVIEKENLILVTAPKYFSLKDQSTVEVGVNNLNNL